MYLLTAELYPLVVWLTGRSNPVTNELTYSLMSVMLQLSLSSAVIDDGQSPFEAAVTGVASVLLLPLAFPSQRHLPHA